MSIYATLRARAMKASPTRDPDTLHGLLALRELGNGTQQLAHAVGLGLTELTNLLADASEGRVGRVLAYRGDGPVWPGPQPGQKPSRPSHRNRPSPKLKAIPRVKPPKPHFKRWQQAILAAMIRPKGVTAADVRKIYVQHGLVTELGAILFRFREAISAHGILYDVEGDSHSADRRFFVRDRHRAKALELLEADRLRNAAREAA